MKKTIIKGIILAAVFFIFIFILTQWRGKDDQNQITTMGEATFPTIYLTSFENNINELHGYADDMEANYMRDTITPLSEDRVLPITINNYGSKILKLSYEVRSSDTTRLVEQTEVTDFKDNGDYFSANLNIKNLLEDNKEYILKIIISTKTAENINYYTRIIKKDKLNVKEKVDFVKEFNQKTFDKSQAEDLVIYLESNSSGDSSSFNKVTINSKFEQVTWGQLNATRETEPIPQIKEIDSQTASIVLKYVVSIQNENDSIEYYNVKEYYRIRYTQDRIYLLDFERSMTQIFDESNSVFKDNRLTLGIRDENIEYKDNPSGNLVAFVQEGELYVLNISENKIVKAFSFRDDVLDTRDNYDQFDIKILDVDDEGNVAFLVYGYMNRGDYEGQVGIDVFYYSSNLNTLEERLFIPSTHPYQMMKQSISNFVYLNEQDKMYIDIDDSIYCVDLAQQSYTEVVNNLPLAGYVISKDNSILAWQNGENAKSSTKITILDLSGGQKNTVEVGDDERVIPIGFMDNDFIYGVAKAEDIITDDTGVTLFPMYCLKIQDSNGDIIEEYQQDGIYISDAQIIDNVIKLTRVTLNDTGYSYIEDDSIMNSLDVDKGKTSQNSIVTETKETQQQLVLGYSLKEKMPTLVMPKQILSEKDLTLKLKSTKKQQDKYFVYAKGELQGIFQNISEAIIEADSLYGVVVDKNQEYIWERGNRLIRTSISGITPRLEENGNSLAACLDCILELSGKNVDCSSLMDKGENAVSILSDHIDGTIVEMSHASLSAALYYVSKGSPVIAKMDDNTQVLIVGYDELNISVMNPLKGTIYKIGMNDSTNLFETAGGIFITYLSNQ
ncbi:hypothetical protein [Lachnotalea glycerini]|uniref:Uncharacterized protein n=1 Tax=Lachnotalea glycerini TaxID=1763509 RepID=A0A371J574_9FIRM|nr:hypothetical protein [Lachnotalea glycerini]RDY27941.1 hypothetical protein CG710_020145 [Lachnotalea glycerini]